MATATRRKILASACSGVSLLALRGMWPSSARAQDAGTEVRRLGERLHVITADGVNVIASTAVDGTVLVDGGSSATSDAVLAAVAELPGAAAVQTLFNTHWHPEQTGSNIELAS